MMYFTFLNKKTITAILGILFLVACHSQDNIVLKEGDIQVIKAKYPNGEEMTYHYVSPVKKNENITALLVAIDPHGNGKLAVKQFLPAAAKFHCMVIGLDDVRNNLPDFESRIQAAVNNATREFSLSDKPVIYAGFSGGARMALQFGYVHNASGIIMCGAGPGNLWQSKLAFPLVAISGTKDFNFAELYYPPNASIVNDQNKLALYFNGIHEWPSPQLLSEAVSFVYLRARINKSEKILKPKEIIRLSDSLAKKGDYLRAFKELELGTKTHPKDEELKKKMNALLSKPEINNYFYQLVSDLREEYSRNNSYVADLDKYDTTWWKNEIKKLDGLSGTTTDKLQSDSYARSRAFLGILLYSKTNNALHSQATANQTEKLLKIYKWLEPDNPDVYYFRALYDYHNHNTVTCIQNLKKSSQLGFNDYGRLHADFPKDIWVQVFPES